MRAPGASASFYKNAGVFAVFADGECAQWGEFAKHGPASRYGRAVERDRSRQFTVYLEMSREKGIEPGRKFSGKFNVRLDPGDHAAAVIAAAAAGKSLNEWIVGAIRQAAECGGKAA